MYNVVIIGAGPAGIFAALEITKLRPDWKVALVEKGQKIENRKCPLREGYAKSPSCKKSGLLSVFKIYLITDAIFCNFGDRFLRDGKTGQRIESLTLTHTLQFPDGDVVALVDAPEGTAAPPTEPSSSHTSTSTLGFPRESSISLA